MEISSSVFYSLIIALLASFTLITIYYSVVFFLRNRLLLLTAAGSEESPWSSKGVDIESSSSSRPRLDINNSKGDIFAGSTVEQKCAAECLSEFEYGDAVRVLPECSRRSHVGRIKEWLKLHSCCTVCRAKTMNKTARGQEKHKIASLAVGSDYCDGRRGSWTATLFWWAAVEDCAIVI